MFGYKYCFVYTLSLILWLASVVAVAKDSASKSILIRNVTLINQSEEQSDVLVNILINKQKLDIITEDTIPLAQADESFDATGGAVLGELKLGAVANFLILSGDPRNDVSLLLDTKKHTLFAIHKGRVLVNKFLTIAEESPAEKTRASQGWLAYSPPPLAVPINYQNTERSNHFDSHYISGLFTGALLIDRQTWTAQNSQNYSQVGDLDGYNGGQVRGLRFGGIGTLNFKNPWIWTVFAASHALDKGYDSRESDDYTLYDLRLDIPLGKTDSFSIGKQKEPISMERLMSLGYGPLGERAAVSDALLPSRNVGIVAAKTLSSERITLAGGAFNNWLDKDQPNSFSDNATQLVSRATWTPLRSDDDTTLLHIGGSLRYSDQKKVLKYKSAQNLTWHPVILKRSILSRTAPLQIRLNYH